MGKYENNMILIHHIYCIYMYIYIYRFTLIYYLIVACLRLFVFNEPCAKLREYPQGMFDVFKSLFDSGGVGGGVRNLSGRRLNKDRSLAMTIQKAAFSPRPWTIRTPGNLSKNTQKRWKKRPSIRNHMGWCNVTVPPTVWSVEAGAVRYPGGQIGGRLWVSGTTCTGDGVHVRGPKNVGCWFSGL